MGSGRRNIFIVNPKAGKNGEKNKELLTELYKVQEKYRELYDIELFITKSKGDGERFVREICQKRSNFGDASLEELRFFACGGDGTLNEVINGACGHENAFVGCVPTGSGNDYVRNFGEIEAFNSLENQLNGNPIVVDLIEYTYFNYGKVNGWDNKIKCEDNNVFRKFVNHKRYCANMTNMGFDSNVAYTASKVKTLPFMTGKLAYLAGILVNFILKKGINAEIDIFLGKSIVLSEKALIHDKSEDGSINFKGKHLICAVGKGKTCGGGLKTMPIADFKDGMLDVAVVNYISRLRFLKFVKHYTNGNFINMNEARDIVEYNKCERVIVKPLKSGARISIDGEISSLEAVEFRVAPKAMKFILPKGL